MSNSSIFPPSPTWQIGTSQPIWTIPATTILPNTPTGTIFEVDKIFKKPRFRDLSWTTLKKLALSTLDKVWLRKLAKTNKYGWDVPETVLRKLLAQGLVEIRLTTKGRKEAFIDAVLE